MSRRIAALVLVVGIGIGALAFVAVTPDDPPIADPQQQSTTSLVERLTCSESSELAPEQVALIVDSNFYPYDRGIEVELNYVRWKYRATADERVMVHPDGCLDLLLISRPDRDIEARVTDWDIRSAWVELDAGTTITGFRFRPGIVVSLADLRDIDIEEHGLGSIIDEMYVGISEIVAAVDFLAAPNATVEGAAKQLGVTSRTLQRRFQALSLPNPDFWRLLGRVRRAVAALPCRVPIADIAYEYGYSDQAHLTRDLRRWFGASPVGLRRNTNLIHEICQPGLGNWPAAAT